MWQRLLVRLLWWRYVKAIGRASDRGAPPEFAFDPTPRRNRAPSFALVRIIGNDLVPRHRPGQSLENLRFILENEKPFASCSKLYILNHIVDQASERRLIDLLERHGACYRRLPFDADQLARQPWDVVGVPADLLPPFQRFARLWPMQAGEILMRLYRHRNNAVINNNGARNRALEIGRDGADWVLPWDGNCFLTESGWQAIQHSVIERPELPFRTVPLARMTDNRQLLDPDFSPRRSSFGEPQIIFRADTPLHFDERFFYGRRPKVEMLWRLGVPGPWDQWGIQPWDWPCPPYCDEAGGWSEAGWVGRLFSGHYEYEGRADRATNRRRTDARSEAVIEFLDRLDAIWIERHWDGLQILSLKAVQAPTALDFQQAMDRCRELERRCATVVSENLAGLFDLVFLLERFGQNESDERAVAILSAWFCNRGLERGGLLPSPAQISRRGGQGMIESLIGLYWFLPSLKRLQRRRPNDTAVFELVRDWLLCVQSELKDPRAGVGCRGAVSAAGLAGDLILASLGVHQKQARQVACALRDATCRLARMGIEADAWMSDQEIDRCFVPLTYLADLTGFLGVSLWRYPSSDRSWMQCWLKRSLARSERAADSAARLSPVIASLEREFGQRASGRQLEYHPPDGGSPGYRPLWWLDLHGGFPTGG